MFFFFFLYKGFIFFFFFFFQAEDGIRDLYVTGVQTCALPITGIRAGSAIAAQQAARAGIHGAPPGKPALHAQHSFLAPASSPYISPHKSLHMGNDSSPHLFVCSSYAMAGPRRRSLPEIPSP